MIVLIPARIGSKGVPLKNLRDLGGYPLLAWSIAAGRLLGYPTVVSSDSRDIVGLARKYGVFGWSRQESSDTQTDVEVVSDFVTITPEERMIWQETCHLKRIPDWSEIIFLLPTTPFRNPVWLKEAVKGWGRSGADSLCSGHILTESADKYFKHTPSGRFIPYNPSVKLADIHKPRQLCTETIQGNGVIGIFKTDRIGEGVLWGNDMLGYITPYTPEIDDESDLEYCRWLLSRKGHSLLDYMKAVYGKT